MKKVLVIVLFLFIAGKSFSQAYMDKIVKESCSCVQKVSDSLSDAEFNMKVGLCMYDVSLPYKKQIKKDYDIELEEADPEECRKLGKIIGVKMISACPDGIVKITNRVKAQKEGSVAATRAQGVVTKIDEDGFISISVKDNSGQTTKYYWLTNVESNLDLKNEYGTLLNKSVNITYTTQEMFDPKAEDYRKFYVIKKINIVE